MDGLYDVTTGKAARRMPFENNGGDTERTPISFGWRNINQVLCKAEFYLMTVNPSLQTP